MIESFILSVKKHLAIPCKILATLLLLTISILQSTSAAAANTLILDNGQPGTSFNGTWKVSGGVNPYGSNSLYASENGASYTFNVDLATPGEYQVFARWTEYNNRRTSVPYDIIHETGTSTVNVNQQQEGGTWQKLGSTWIFNNQATIRIRSLGNGTTSADAIKLVYVGNNAALPALPDDLSGSTLELDNSQPAVSANLPSNRAPVISGTPAASVAEESAYVFQPTASDADGDNLTYSISSQPSWASFSTGTGRLSGTPKNGDAGSYSNITITVSDRSASASIGPFSIQVAAAPSPTGNLSVSWTAPVARADGEPLSLADISGYHIYFGGSSGNYTDFAEVNDGAATSWTVTDVPVGTSYVVMTTFDSEGRESVYSQEVSKPVQ